MARRRRRWKDAAPYCRCTCLSQRARRKGSAGEEDGNNGTEKKANNMAAEEEEDEVGQHQVTPLVTRGRHWWWVELSLGGSEVDMIRIGCKVIVS